MKAKAIPLKILATVTTLILFAFAAKADETAAVQAANAEFYEALNAMFTGDLEPMKQIWSHSGDVTYMGPDGGFQVGWEQVLPNWEKQAALKLGGKVEPSNVVVNVGTNLAVAHNYEKGQNKDKDGKTVTVSIRATNLFRKEDGKWRMIGHHTDLLPFLKSAIPHD